MSHKAVGTATVDHQVTTIRKYTNGHYTVEVNGDVKYSSTSLEDLEEQLNKNGVPHTVLDRS